MSMLLQKMFILEFCATIYVGQSYIEISENASQIIVIVNQLIVMNLTNPKEVKR